MERYVYEPTRFMLPTSHYDKEKADRAVIFIESLKHTKGAFYNQPFKLLDWQDRIVRDLMGVVKEDGTRQFKQCIAFLSKKNGKQLALDTPIPTPQGFTAMGDLKVGDTVFDENGVPCHVIAKSAVDDTEQAYKLTFRDGTSIIAGARHLWDCDDLTRYKNPRVTLSTQEIYEKQLEMKGSRSAIRIPVAKPIQTEDVNLPVDPYLYGYWLGNGTATEARITVRTSDVEDVKSNIPYELHNSFPQKCGGSSCLYYRELRPILVNNCREKVILPEYLRASESQRWALLQGLMDSDGSISKVKGQSTYTTTIRPLAESVRELLWSLGIKNAVKAEPSTRNGWPTGEILYVIRFTTFTGQPTARLIRKAVWNRVRNGDSRSNYHYLKSITPVEQPVKMQCIQVDSPSHLYLAGPSMVPTHNSELAAAIALYLLCADHEQRAEIYGAAADRQMASLVFNVAADIIRLSPALRKRCKILDSRKRIIFTPTNSFYQVLSSDADRAHGVSAHGVIVDEVHVQKNPDLVNVLTKGSGDARKQPLQFIISTAGDNIHSIGYELFQKAKDILEGRKTDPTIYPVVYAADPEDDWTDPEVWKKANPSMGVTFPESAIQEACESAKQNPSEENVFKTLRLNIWTKQAVRWMPMEQWDKCAVPVDAEALRGRPCYAGLDLSSTQDLTALVLVFPPTNPEEPYSILPFAWVPEETIDQRSRRDHVNYDLWQKQGHILATPGNVIDYAAIEAKIMELREIYDIREIAYDRWNSQMLIQHLSDEGMTVVPFGQGMQSMSPPTKELFKLTLEKKLAHGGHPVLRWCMDNVVVDQDAAGNIKITKARATEKVDLAVALVMALDRAVRHEMNKGESVYENRGLLFI